MAVATAIAAAAAITSAVVGAVKAKKARVAAEAAKARAEARVSQIERGRQPIINPYDQITDTSTMAKDLSDMAANPYANLSVATQASEIEAEEADIALANTLDTIRASGASAGGATALAQAALKSKQGISASIEKQEVNNEKLRAEGEAKLQEIEMDEAQRMQMINMSEAQRLQSANAMGRAYQFEAKENRDATDLSRYSAKAANERQREVDARAAQTQAVVSGIAAVGNIAGGANLGKFGGGSDRRLKKNIKLISYSPSGLKIYAFEYINKAFGEGVWQGVMSDEIPQCAVIKHPDGYDRVDYFQLDVDFKQIKS